MQKGIQVYLFPLSGTPVVFFIVTTTLILVLFSYQLGEAVFEFARGNYEKALELFGSEFNAIGYKVK